jgi:hypothetical protein
MQSVLGLKQPTVKKVDFAKLSPTEKITHLTEQEAAIRQQREEIEGPAAREAELARRENVTAEMNKIRGERSEIEREMSAAQLELSELQKVVNRMIAASDRYDSAARAYENLNAGAGLRLSAVGGHIDEIEAFNAEAVRVQTPSTVCLQHNWQKRDGLYIGNFFAKLRSDSPFERLGKITFAPDTFILVLKQIDKQ